MYDKYIVSNNLVFWCIVIVIFIITYSIEFLISKDKKKIIKVCNTIKNVMIYLIGLEIVNWIVYKIYNSLH